MLTCNPLEKPWFGLQDRLGKLSPLKLESMQCLLVVDLSIQWDPMVMDLTLLLFHGTTPIYLSSDPTILDLPDPTMENVPKLKRNSHDPLNPPRGSMTFRLLHSICNTIPPGLFNFIVRF
jgi:hypothetical protein